MKYFLALALLAAPTYIIKISLFGLPANLLMLWLVIVWLVFALTLTYKKQWSNFFENIKSIDLWLKVSIGLFLVAGTLSLFVGGISLAKLGQYLVLVIQPISLFLIVRFTVAQDESARDLFKKTLYFFLALSGIYAMIQYFTLAGLPMDWWGNANEPKRAVSFFIHPNFYSLFITPLLAYLLPDLLSKLPERATPTLQVTSYKLQFCSWSLGVLGLLFSLSRGGWLGLLAALGVFVIIKANKKLLQGALIAGAVMVMVVAAVPNLRYRVLLPFYGEKSSVARFSLWHTGWLMIEDGPVLGKGLTGFASNWDQYNTDPGLEHYNFPHNIILNFWVDTGILGVISIVTLFIYGIFYGVKNKRNNYQCGLVLMLVAIVVHGLIDIPYLKNDLALIFWMLWGLSW